MMEVDHTVQSRLEKAPLSAISFLLNFTSIVGNFMVLHIFWSKTYESHSNYRLFVLFIAALDFGTALEHIFKEVNRIVRGYNGGNNHACTISYYIGYSTGFATLLIVLFIAIERYKKICTPFQNQITIKQSKAMCVVVIAIGAVLNVPIAIIYGKRTVEIETNINATRCGILNRFDNNLLPILHFGFLNFLSLLAVIFIVVTQVKVRGVILHQTALRKRIGASTNQTASDSSAQTNFTEIAEKSSETDEKNNVSAIQGSKLFTISQKLAKVKNRAEEDQNIRITFTFCIVTILLLVSFQAFLWYQTLLSLHWYLKQEGRISKTRDTFYEYFPDIITLNGVLNPFVYYFTDNKFNRKLKGFCRG